MILPHALRLRLIPVAIFIIVVTTVTGVTLTLPGAAESAPPLPDLQNHGAQRELRVLYNKGIIAGFPDGLFHPESQLTRAQLAKMVVESKGLGPEAELLLGARTRFSDVSRDHWAAAYIEVAADVGVIKGYPDGTFRPDQPVSRTELVVMVVRALGWETQVRTVDKQTIEFQDREAIPDWAAGYVALAHRRRLADSFADGTFRPGEPATRAAAALMITQMLVLNNTLYDTAGFVDSVSSTGFVASVGGQQLNLTLMPQTDIFLGENLVDASELQVLDEVGVVFDEQGRPTQVDIFRSDVTGVVRSVEQTTGTITLSVNEQVRSIPVKADAPVFRNGAPASLSDVEPGDRVYAVLSVISGGAAYIDAVRFNRSGRVVSLGENGAVEIVSSAGKRSTLTIPGDTLVLINGQTASGQDLALGDILDCVVDGDVAVYVEARRGEQ